MSDTPRTDFLFQNNVSDPKNTGEYVLELDAADTKRLFDSIGQLERELTAEKAHHARTDQKWQRDYNQAVAERIQETTRADAAMGFTSLTELLEDKKRLDWLDEHAADLEVRIHTTDAIHRYAPIFGEMGGGCPFRSAIDAARKATP